MRFLLTLVFSLSPFWISGNDVPRLIVYVDPEATFSAEEFAACTSAEYIEIDQRNPYKTLLPICLEHPFICGTLSDSSMRESLSRRLADRCGYRYLRFTEETLDEAVAITSALLPTIPTSSSEIKSLSLEDSQKLYHLLDKIDRIFTENGIGYWAGRGTLLGAVVYDGLMPWEDYHTLHMFADDEQKLLFLSDAFYQEGLVLHAYFKHFYKIFEINGDAIPDRDQPGDLLPFRYPVADLFLMSLECRHEAEDVYVHKSWDFYWHWNDEKFSYSQLLGIQRVPFGPLSIPIPADPEKTLNGIYGMPQNPELWKTYAFEPLWDHKTEDHPPWKGSALVEIDDFSPAGW